jgi:hypothetical protein
MNVDLPNKNNDHPLYQQVADRLRQLITEGTLQPGDRGEQKIFSMLSILYIELLPFFLFLKRSF